MSDPTAGLAGTVEVASDQADLARRTADWLLAGAGTAIAEGRRFAVAVSGGRTPGALYDLLASSPVRDRTDWSRWEVWFADERACPPDDPASNYWLAHDRLLRHVPVDPLHVHRMRAESPDLEAAATDYEAELVRHLPPGPGGAPRVDCVLLGLGTNGHTASLFPGQPVWEIADRWVAPARADYPPYDRLTLTLPTLNAAARVGFLVAGADKGKPLREVVAGIAVAALVHPVNGELRWFIDQEATAAMRAA